MVRLKQKKRGITPPNSRVVDSANRSIERLAPYAREENTNTLEVNGYPAYLYNPIRHGRKCPCQLKGADPLKEDGNMDDETMEEVLAGGEDEPDTGTFSIDLSDVDESNESDSSFTEDELTLEADVNFKACGVCLGTGFIGGFDYSNGQRLILTTTNYDRMDGVRLANSGQGPPLFYADVNGGWVEFDTYLPAGAIYVDVLKAMENLEVSRNWNVSIDGNEVSMTNILDFCDGKQHTVRLTAVRSEVILTHFLLQIGSYDKPLYVSFPSIADYRDALLGEATTGVDLVVPPVTNVLLGAVVTESVRDRSWRITSVEAIRDHNRQVYHWACSVSLIQPQELTNSLSRPKYSQPLATSNAPRR